MHKYFHTVIMLRANEYVCAHYCGMGVPTGTGKNIGLSCGVDNSSVSEHNTDLVLSKICIKIWRSRSDLLLPCNVLRS